MGRGWRRCSSLGRGIGLSFLVSSIFSFFQAWVLRGVVGRKEDILDAIHRSDSLDNDHCISDIKYGIMYMLTLYCRKRRHDDQPLGCPLQLTQAYPDPHGGDRHRLEPPRPHAHLLDRERQLRRARAHLRRPPGPHDCRRPRAPSDQRALLRGRERAARVDSGRAHPDAGPGEREVTEGLWRGRE